jgi:hypothetical protein
VPAEQPTGRTGVYVSPVKVYSAATSLADKARLKKRTSSIYPLYNGGGS